MCNIMLNCHVITALDYITWANVDPDLYNHMASQCHNELFARVKFFSHIIKPMIDHLTTSKIVITHGIMWIDVIPSSLRLHPLPECCHCIWRVSCQKGPICHAQAWQVGPFWQDTIDMWMCHHFITINLIALCCWWHTLPQLYEIQGTYSIWICHLTSTGIPSIKPGWS